MIFGLLLIKYASFFSPQVTVCHKHKGQNEYFPQNHLAKPTLDIILILISQIFNT